MSNLDRYLDITTEAKKAGGVDAWIANVESDAVAEALPVILATGAAIGVAVTLGARYVTERVQRRRVRAAQSRAMLRQTITEQED